MSKPVAGHHATQVNPGSAPEIGPASSGDASLRRLIAISATPAPPAAEVSVPQGNLSARVSISPDGTKAGVPGGSGHDASATGGATAKSAGGSATSLPASVSISGANGRSGASGAGAAGNRASGIVLKPMPKIGAPPDPGTPHGEPIDVTKIDPSLPPDKILSGKEVFTLHVDMPNFTSASGSWILNFAQLDDGGPGYLRPKGKLGAPVPVRKVDPKYPQLAIKKRIEGEIILYAIIRKEWLSGQHSTHARNRPTTRFKFNGSAVTLAISAGHARRPACGPGSGRPHHHFTSR